MSEIHARIRIVIRLLFQRMFVIEMEKRKKFATSNNNIMISIFADTTRPRGKIIGLNVIV